MAEINKPIYKLSILVCTVPSRVGTYLPKIITEIQRQIDALPEEYKEDVELLYLGDNKRIMLGDKRNILVDIAAGKYVVFVDDDDRISEDYVFTLLEKISNTDADAINFTVMVSLNGDEPKPCYYSIGFKGNVNHADKYERLPNHICCIKKDIVSKVRFKPMLLGEDTDFSLRARRIIKTEIKINKVLYYYDYLVESTEPQKDAPSRKFISYREYLRKLKNRIVTNV